MVILSHSIADVKHFFGFSCVQWTHPAVVFKLCLGGTLGCWFRLYPGDTQRGRLKISDGLKPDLMILVLHRSWLSPVCPLSTPVTAEITVSTGHTRLLVSNCIQWIHPAGDSKCVRGTHLAVGYKLCPGDTPSLLVLTV